MATFHIPKWLPTWQTICEVANSVDIQNPTQRGLGDIVDTSKNSVEFNYSRYQSKMGTNRPSHLPPPSIEEFFILNMVFLVFVIEKVAHQNDPVLDQKLRLWMQKLGFRPNEIQSSSGVGVWEVSDTSASKRVAQWLFENDFLPLLPEGEFSDTLLDHCVQSDSFLSSPLLSVLKNLPLHWWNEMWARSNFKLIQSLSDYEIENFNCLCSIKENLTLRAALTQDAPSMRRKI